MCSEYHLYIKKEIAISVAQLFIGIIREETGGKFCRIHFDKKMIYWNFANVVLDISYKNNRLALGTVAHSLLYKRYENIHAHTQPFHANFVDILPYYFLFLDGGVRRKFNSFR